MGQRRAIAEWAVAATTGLLALLTYRHGYETVVPMATIAMIPLVAWIVTVDLRSFIIPDGAVVALAGLALAIRFAANDALLLILCDVLLSGGVLLTFREIYYYRRGFDGLGLGDVKLAAAGGMLVGAEFFAYALLGASLLGIVCVIVSRPPVCDPETQSGKIAFGALLAPAVYFAWLAQALPFLRGA